MSSQGVWSCRTFAVNCPARIQNVLRMTAGSLDKMSGEDQINFVHYGYNYEQYLKFNIIYEATFSWVTWEMVCCSNFCLCLCSSCIIANDDICLQMFMYISMFYIATSHTSLGSNKPVVVMMWWRARVKGVTLLWRSLQSPHLKDNGIPPPFMRVWKRYPLSL